MCVHEREETPQKNNTKKRRGRKAAGRGAQTKTREKSDSQAGLKELFKAGNYRKRRRRVEKDGSPEENPVQGEMWRNKKGLETVNLRTETKKCVYREYSTKDTTGEDFQLGER